MEAGGARRSMGAGVSLSVYDRTGGTGRRLVIR